MSLYSLSSAMLDCLTPPLPAQLESGPGWLLLSMLPPLADRCAKCLQRDDQAFALATASDATRSHPEAVRRDLLLDPHPDDPIGPVGSRLYAERPQRVLPSRVDPLREVGHLLVDRARHETCPLHRIRWRYEEHR